MITKLIIKYKIWKAGEQGIWVGYIREHYKKGAAIVDKLQKSGKYEKVKKENPVGKPITRQGMVWAIVRKEK